MSGKLCRFCGQPMKPKGVKKLPNEYDHAQGCPAARGVGDNAPARVEPVRFIGPNRPSDPKTIGLLNKMFEAAYQEKAHMTCDKAPAGWECTRDAGHDGPCAAQPVGTAKPESEKECEL